MDNTQKQKATMSSPLVKLTEQGRSAVREWVIEFLKQLNHTYGDDDKPIDEQEVTDMVKRFEANLREKHNTKCESESEEMKEYNGVLLPRFVDGREVVAYPNAGINLS